jgi:ABC-type dipeptide/oligopeptide/nickel transport system ATPase component
MAANNILEIINLTVFPDKNKKNILVNDVSFSLEKGKLTCIVGESGSGKSLTALSIIKLLSSQLKFDGIINFENNDLSQLNEKKLREFRGKEISMIFQDPMTSLNPVFTVGYQVAEALHAHNHMSKSEARKIVEQTFQDVGIPSDRYESYPDELSGGQRQRVMIAMAIINKPKLLIADEPTTALDVTVQKQVLNLIQDLQKKYQMTVLFITHDFGVVEDIADQVLVMYQGRIVEQGKANSLIRHPKHPYTKALLQCIPSIHSKKVLKPIDYKWLKTEMEKL